MRRNLSDQGGDRLLDNQMMSLGNQMALSPRSVTGGGGFSPMSGGMVGFGEGSSNLNFSPSRSNFSAINSPYSSKSPYSPNHQHSTAASTNPIELLLSIFNSQNYLQDVVVRGLPNTNAGDESDAEDGDATALGGGDATVGGDMTTSFGGDMTTSYFGGGDMTTAGDKQTLAQKVTSKQASKQLPSRATNPPKYRSARGQIPYHQKANMNFHLHRDNRWIMRNDEDVLLRIPVWVR